MNDKKQVTNFAKILKTLRISGTELSEILHIDPSLISKWRTNKRKFRASSPLFEELVEYLLSLDAANDYKKIRDLLRDEYTNVQEAGFDRIKSYLKKWLIDAVSETESLISFLDYMDYGRKPEVVSSYVFRGNEGKRAAVSSLLQLAIALNKEEPQELFCYLKDDQTWFSEQNKYVDEWEKLNKEFLSTGGFINVIHPMNRRNDQLAFSLLAWLPLYLTGKVKAYFLSDTDQLHIFRSILILKGRLLMYQVGAANSTEHGICLLTEDRNLVAETLETISPGFQIASPCFVPYFQNDGNRYMNFLAHMVNLDESQYLFMKWPFINMISENEMREILEENEIDNDRIEKILVACKKLKTDLRRDTECHFRYLLPKDAVIHLLQEKKVCLDTVSLFSGKPIHISNDRFRIMVGRLIAILEKTDSHTKIKEVALLNEVNAKEMRLLNVMVKNNTCVSIFNDSKCFTEELPWVLTSTEIPVIRALYNMCHNLWKITFPQNKEHDSVARQLKIWLNTISVKEE